MQNATGEDLGLIVGADGDNAPAGSSVLIWSLPPGKTKIGCVGQSAPGGTPDGEVTVQDPDGISTDHGVGGGLGGKDCAPAVIGSFDFVAGAAGEPGDPVGIARARLRDRLKEGDVVQAAGYPEEPERQVIVVRDGSTVADLKYVRDQAGTGWLLDSQSTCDGFNG